jgi:pantothenate synthetase
MYIKKLSLGILILLLLFNAQGYCFKGDTQILTLKQKMTEISELYEKVSQKIALITQMRQELNASKRTFIEEIIKETKGRQISAYNEAIHIPRIHYNLKLIQKLEGYTTALRQKTAYLKDANEQLVFYYQQIEDDLKIIETLKDMDVEGLMLGINRALDAYRPETKKHIIYADRIEFYHPQEVWRKIMAGML